MKFILAFFLGFSSFSYADSKNLSAPQLFFEYSWLYDSNCSNTPERKIEPEWIQEAKQRTPEFIKIWDMSGNVLFDKVFEVFGLGFKRKELTATISVCPTPSYSNPLVLNVNAFLNSYSAPKPPLSDDAFADLVFHELLHTWISENINWPTPLIKKYMNEDKVVRNHLHLMSVQKHIYTLIKRDDLVEMIEKQYTKKMNSPYFRAWEIVTKIEGHEPFIFELKKTK